jgi:mycobactin lysine-N-oxygenase
MPATIAAIGAEAEGIALAAKPRALAEAGLDAPGVVLIDRHGATSSWSSCGAGWLSPARATPPSHWFG